MRLTKYKSFFESSSNVVYLHKFTPSEAAFHGYSGEIFSKAKIISDITSIFFDVVNNKHAPNALGKKFKTQITGSSFNIAFDSSKLKEMYAFLKKEGYAVTIEDSSTMEHLKNEIAYLVKMYKKKKDRDPEFFNRGVKQIYSYYKRDSKIIDKIISSYNLE